MFAPLREDVQTVLDRDPAAYHWLQVVLCYPGLHAIWVHRIAHRLWTVRLKLLAHVLAYFARSFTGIEIHPAAVLGRRLFIDHGMGIVIGETAEVGEDVTIYHGVTLGGVSLSRGKRHPTIEDQAVIGSGAKVLGAITIGRNTRIGANAVVTKDVEPDMVVVGIPGKPVEKKRVPTTDLPRENQPDVISERLDNVLSRLENIEAAVRLHNEDHFGPEVVIPEPDYVI